MLLLVDKEQYNTQSEVIVYIPTSHVLLHDAEMLRSRSWCPKDNYNISLVFSCFMTQTRALLLTSSEVMAAGTTRSLPG